VERIGDHHRGDRAILERDLLGDTVEHAGGAGLVGEDDAQRLLRFNRDHVQAEHDQRARQLARPGGEVHDAITRLDAELGRGRADDRRRILRPPPLVHVRDRGELLG
jgi:hypothetical protein